MEEKAAVHIALRGQYDKEEDAQAFEGGDAEQVLRQVLGADVRGIKFPVLKVESGSITFLDADTHEWTQPPTDEQLEAYVAALRRGPDVWWRTHGDGLRLGFIGEHHEERALAAALELPRAFKVELKRNSRHPGGNHPDRPGATCGAVHWNPKPDHSPVDWGAVGHLDRDRRDKLLREHGYEPGGRYDHDKCPVAGHEDSGAGGCVVVLDDAIFCHRCAGKGISVEGQRPGVFPIARLDEKANLVSVFARLAMGFVHWAHARLELTDAYPNVADQLLREVYRRVLEATHLECDPRIDMVFNPSLKIVAAEGAWLDAESLQPFRVTEKTAHLLPAVIGAKKEPGKKGKAEWKITIDSALVERAINCFLLPGYNPIRVVRGVAFSDAPGMVTVEKQPDHEPPIRLLPKAEMMSDDEVRETFERSFPGIQLNALTGLCAARICAEKSGAPVIIQFIGPTGSGKGQTVHLGGRVLGSPHKPLRLAASSEEEWRREVGTALLAGYRLLYVNEVARIPKLGTLIRRILDLESSYSCRLLYVSSDAAVRLDAVMILASLTVPEIFATSPEVCRRIWVYRFPRTVPDWRGTTGEGGTAEWRGALEHNARAANTLLTKAFNLAAQHDSQFDLIAPKVGFARPDEGGDYVDERALMDLYQHCRGEYGERRFHERGRFVDGNWVDGNGPDALAILERVEPAGDDDYADRKNRMFHLQKNLEARDWNRLLKIDEPNVVFEMRTYGQKIAIRFREDGVLKGAWRVNDKLPPPQAGGPHPPGAPDPDGDDDPGDPGGQDGGVASDAGDNRKTSQGTADEGPDASGGGADLTDLPRSANESVRSKNAPKPMLDKDIDERPRPICQICQENTIPKGRADGDMSGGESIAKPWQNGQNGAAGLPGAGVNALQASDLGQSGRSDSLPVRSWQNEGEFWQNGTTIPADQWPGQHLVIDFETYFDREFNLQKLTIPEYVHDLRFRVHGVAIRWPDGRTEFRTDVNEGLAEIAERYGERWERVITVAFNGHFDGYILNHIYGIRPAFWMDPMAMARQVLPGRSSYSLEALADALGLPPKGKELDGLMGVRDPKPQQMAELRSYAVNDVKVTHALLEKLLPQVSRPEVELRLVDQCIRLFTERAFSVDPDEATKLHEQVEAEVAQACADAGCSRDVISSDTEFTKALNEAMEPTCRTVPTKPDKNGMPILAFAKDDESYRELLADADPKVRALARARALIQSAPASLRRVERIAKIARATNGRLPVPLNYHAAHTGRYGGAGGINLQNLPQRVGGVADRIASLLQAQPGCVLVGADSSQIEARVLAMLVGQKNLLEAFREGRDVYSEFASGVFGEQVRKPLNSDPPERAARMRALRYIGKRSILGLGYGMGAERFKQTLRTDPEAQPLFDSGELNDSRIRQVVYEDYQRGYPSIPRFWKDLEQAFHDAVVHGVGDCQSLKCGMAAGGVHLHLPSGRVLCYRKADIDASGGLVYEGQKGKEKLWGGKLTENVCQAVARDIICEAMLKAEEAGYAVILQVHDEIVLQVAEDKAEEAKAFLLKVLKMPPLWLPDLPLDAEAWVAERYGEGA